MLFLNKAQAILGALIAPTRYISLPTAFLAVTGLTLGGCCGIIYLIRANTDPYSAIPIDAINIILIGAFWCAAVLSLIVLGIIAKQQKVIRDLNAILVVLSVTELIGAGFYTNYMLSYIPRSHMREDTELVKNYIETEKKKLPEKMNEYVTLTDIYYTHQQVVLSYQLKEEKDKFWNPDDMKAVLLDKTCTYFSDYLKLLSVKSLSYVFFTDKEFRYKFDFKKKDCQK